MYFVILLANVQIVPQIDRLEVQPNWLTGKEIRRHARLVTVDRSNTLIATLIIFLLL